VHAKTTPGFGGDVQATSRRLAAVFLVVVMVFFGSGNAYAVNYDVGAGQTYATLNDLRNASITWANGDTITIHNDDSTLTGAFNFGNANVTIKGKGVISPASGVIERFALSNGSINVTPDSGETIEFRGFAIGGNNEGGAIYAGDRVTVGSNGVFSGNSAGSSGGAIYAEWDVTIGDNGVFSGNSAGRDGGAIFTYGGGVTVGDNGLFSGNTAGGDGGAIMAWSDVTIGSNGLFSGNSAGRDGGAIMAWSDVTIGSNGLFSENSAGSSGGAIYGYDGVNVGGNTYFTGNLAGGSGGAIFIRGSTSPTATFDTTAGDIAFAGNKSGVTFSGGIPDLGTGVFNSIFLNQNITLQLQGNNNIYFNDPITSGTNGGNSLVKTGSGFVQFLGSSVLNPNGQGGGAVTVSGGTFRVADGASFTTGSNDATKKFTVESGGTLAGGGTITSNQGFVIFGTISPDSLIYAIPDYDYSTQTFGATKTPTGTNIGTLQLRGDVLFNDGARILIDTTANTNDKVVITGAASIAAGATLSTGVGPTAALEAATFDFNTTGKLDITGYTPDTSSPYNGPQNVQTVITTTGGITGITNFDSLITVAGNSALTTDFLSASAFLSPDNREVKVETRLTWYSTDPNRKAHGDFTVGSGNSFTLGAVLEDTLINLDSAWDGKSLTKLGEGTLILTGANTYTGETIVKAGTMTIGNGGNWNISDKLVLYGGSTLNASGVTTMAAGNLKKFDVKGAANWGGDLTMGAGDTLNFYIPTGMSANETMLIVSGAANITGSNVAVGINGGSSNLKVGDSVTLIKAMGGLISDYDGTKTKATAIGGLTYHDFLLYIDPAGVLRAEVDGKGATEQAKALSEGQLAGLSFLNMGYDRFLSSLAGLGLTPSDLKNMTPEEWAKVSGLIAFGSLDGGAIRHNSGSHVDVEGVSLVLGLGWRAPLAALKSSIVAGCFVEMGWGNYNSYNSFR